MNTSLQSSGHEALFVITTVLAIVTTIFWMIVGWRAMRAHERIADKLDPK